MNRLVVLLKSKAVWGALFTAGAWLLKQQHVGPLEIMEALGGVLSTAGLRDAITKGPMASR